MADKVDATGEAVITWKSKLTGFTGHGKPMEVETALTAVENANKQYPDLDHVAVPAGKVQEVGIKTKKSS